MAFVELRDEHKLDISVNINNIISVSNDDNNSSGYGDQVFIRMLDGTVIRLVIEYDGYEDGYNPYTYHKVLEAIRESERVSF